LAARQPRERRALQVAAPSADSTGVGRRLGHVARGQSHARPRFPRGSATCKAFVP
jgi:hypothetical protein